METYYYVGLDVHSRDSVFVIQDNAGAVRGRGTVPSTPAGLAQLCQEHQLPPGTTVGLETGTLAFYVARQLAALHLVPVVVDAHEVRRKASRPSQKSDRRDALELCDGVRRGYYQAIVHIPTPRSARCAPRCRGGGISSASKRPRSMLPNGSCVGPAGQAARA